MRHQPGHIFIAIIAAIATAAAIPAIADGTPIPTKFELTSTVGSEVDGTTGQSICTVASKDKCQAGRESEQAGGFAFPESVAVAPSGNVYVADQANHRVQELGPEGRFVSMFGWDVNRTKIEEGASQAERNVCTAASGDVCQAGEALTGEREKRTTPTGLPGQLDQDQDVAVDGGTGDVWVLSYKYHRVEEFTSGGEFVLMIGGEVDATKDGVPAATEAEKNLCTLASGDVCKSGVESVSSSAHGAFKPAANRGTLLAVGGPEDRLYVGDEGRIQEFDKTTGEWVGEIPLNAQACGIAVGASGAAFVAECGSPGVHEYNANGERQAAQIGEGAITAVALDLYGRLGLVEKEPFEPAQGYMYNATGGQVGKFGPLVGGSAGLAFATTGATPTDLLYVAEPGAQDLEIYNPVVFPEVKTCPSAEVTATQATLCGEINPNGVLASGFFLYGSEGSLTTRTPSAFEGEGSAWEPYHWRLPNLVPNQVYQFKAAAVEAEKQQADGEVEQFHTSSPPPEIPGLPETPAVNPQTVVFYATVNPEHAVTAYHFEYGICAKLSECAEVRTTPAQGSSQYGLIGVTQEAQGLVPDTTYSYRLVADNTHGGEGGTATGAESSFTTGLAPAVEAVTGGAVGVTATSAVVFGSVDPDGQPATYTFELGIYAGAATQYGTVLSAPTGADLGFVAESAALVGLQPGTTYAYRITITSGYGTAVGAAALLTTAGLPSLLVAPAVLPQLAIPKIAFPKAPAVKKPKLKKKKKKKSVRKARKGKAHKSRATRRRHSLT